MPVTMRRLLSLLLSLGLFFTLTACGTADPPPSSPTPEAPSPSVTEPAVTPPAPSDPAEPTSDPTPEPTDTTPEPTVDVSDTPAPEPPVEPALPVYTFGTPLAESEVVEDTHFENAAFLGDSRTEGLQLFGGLYYGDFFWARGMTVFRVDDPNYAVFDVDGEMLTMIGALSKKEYDSVYIMVGVNELGYDAGSYEEGLGKFIDKVLEVQPNAVVYLQILPPVNEEVAQKSGLASYINNTRIGLFNEAIIRIATEKKVVLLDTAEAYRDENGSLPAELASDGCHFNYSGYTRWSDYLRNHVMDPEIYHYSRALEPAPEPEPTDAPEPGPEPSEDPSAEPTPAPSAEPGEEPSDPPTTEPTDEVTEV